MNIKGAIFDFDGTLFDSMPVWNTIGEAYLKTKNISVEDNICRKLKTMSLYGAAQYFRRHCGIADSVDKIISDINGMLEAYYTNDVQPKEGTFEFLIKLREKDIKMCIATATDRHLAEAALKRCDMLKFFSGIFTCTEVGHGKEEPHIFKAALDFLSFDINEVLVFEDAFYAIKTAKDAGFKVCAVFDESEENSLAAKEISDIYIHDFSEICMI